MRGLFENFEVVSGGVATEIPIVVLTNRGSASSAEIFAGAIQDHDRGAFAGKGLHNGPADSGTTTRHQYDLLVQSQIHTPSSCYAGKHPGPSGSKVL